MGALHNSRNRQFERAGVALKIRADMSLEWLEYALAPIIIAVGTKVVMGAAIAYNFLERVGKLPIPYVFQRIFILLSIPAFKLSEFAFHFVFFLQKRHLRAIGRQTALLGGHDYSGYFDNIVVDFRDPARTTESVQKVNRSLEAAQRSGNAR